MALKTMDEVMGELAAVYLSLYGIDLRPSRELTREAAMQVEIERLAALCVSGEDAEMESLTLLCKITFPGCKALEKFRITSEIWQRAKYSDAVAALVAITERLRDPSCQTRDLFKRRLSWWINRRKGWEAQLDSSNFRQIGAFVRSWKTIDGSEKQQKSMF